MSDAGRSSMPSGDVFLAGGDLLRLPRRYDDGGCGIPVQSDLSPDAPYVSGGGTHYWREDGSVVLNRDADQIGINGRTGAVSDMQTGKPLLIYNPKEEPDERD